MDAPEKQSMLSAVLNEKAGFRAENVRAISLHDDKQVILRKVDNLKGELLSMKSKFKNCIVLLQ